MWILDELMERKNSEAIAVVHRENKLTYQELWEASEKVAQWITENCVTKNPIIIYGNKDVEIVAIMMGALKTGRAYVPIDITFPEERVKQIINITEAEVLFNISELVIESDSLRASIDKVELRRIVEGKKWEASQYSNWVQGEDNCYILFTSGSTGEPKGVQISKNNIINFVDWFCKEADVSGDVVLNQVSYSFDVSVIQLYIYLALGKTLFCIDKDMVTDFGVLFDYLGKSGIASWVSTPAFIEMCAVYDVFDRKLLPNLTKIILAGEVLTKKLVKSLWDKFPENGGVQIINGYGPTEGTVLLTCCTINKEMVDDEENELPIGYMIDDAKYKVDVSIGVSDGAETGGGKDKGELVVSSASISKGYFKNEKATNQNFFMLPEDRYNSYRTGDVVYKIGEMIYYCGRKDFQIKLNGYRIELDDISENINKIPEISNNVVLPVYRDGRVAYLVAFVVMEKELGLTKVQTSIYIRKSLGKLVPSYMVPKKFIVLDAFPLNTNGKIDRKLLMETYL